MTRMSASAKQKRGEKGEGKRRGEKSPKAQRESKRPPTLNCEPVSRKGRSGAGQGVDLGGHDEVVLVQALDLLGL